MNLPHAAASSFQVVDGAAVSLPAVLRPWSSAPREHMAFATGGAPREPETTWRIVLPGGEEAARQHLAQAERDLHDVAHALPVAEQRLREATRPSSFTSAVDGHDPERSLRAVLAKLSDQQRPSEGTAYSITDLSSSAWERANAAFTAALDHLHHLVTGRSWVETAIEARVIARTMLGRAGNQSTAWCEGVTEDEASLHARAVALTCTSRTALVRTITMAIRGAALIAPIMSGPAGILLALPAVWTFIDDVVAEIGVARAG